MFSITFNFHISSALSEEEKKELQNSIMEWAEQQRQEFMNFNDGSIEDIDIA